MPQKQPRRLLWPVALTLALLLIVLPCLHTAIARAAELPAEAALKSPLSETTLSLHELNALLTRVSRYQGTFNIAGMPVALYDAAMQRQWQVVTPPEGEAPSDLSFQISSRYSYAEYERFILNLAYYPYVTVYRMGDTAHGRGIYNIEIFQPSADVPPDEVVTVMLNAGTHANETMGTHAALKMAGELIQRLQSEATLQEYVKRVRITILPCLNPDGREMVYQGNQDDRKSNAAGIDLNRNFPALNAGILRSGNYNAMTSSVPSKEYYPGSYLGEAVETQIAMKWLNHYIINGNACMLLDLHQYGNGIYFIKPFDTDENKLRQTEFYHFLKDTLRTDGSLTYGELHDSARYGYDGIGGTLTDYAFGVAMGFPYSSQYGRQVMIINGREVSLQEMNSLNDYANYIQPIRPDFVYATIELTAGNQHKGFSGSALSAQHSHYWNQNYHNLLECLMERALGKR